MQIPADPLDAAALDAALQPGQRQYFRHRLEVDWNRDGNYGHALSDLSRAVSTVKVSREMDDSSPGSEAVLSGAASGELVAYLDGSVLVAGEFVPIGEVLAPYNSASPLYKVRAEETPIRYQILTSTSRGWIGIDQFTGLLDERGVRRSGNRVELTAMDVPLGLRGPVFWPPWAVDGPSAARVLDYAPQRALASSVVDQVCNRAGLLTRPRPPWTSHSAVALVWLPLCGSFAPAAGKMISQAPWGNFQLFPNTYPISPEIDPEGEYWVDGPFGLARNAREFRYPGSMIYTSRDSQPTWPDRSTSISAWIYCGPTAPGYDFSPSATLRPPVARVHFGWGQTTNYYAYRLTLAADGPIVQIQVEAGTDRHYRADYTLGTDAWRHVHVQLDHSAGAVRAKMFVDGVERANFVPTGTGNSEVATPLNVLFFPQVGVHLQPGVRMSDMMAWQEWGAPTITPERTVTPGAVIARSLNQISHLPPPEGSGWEVIREVAAAEYASVRVTEQGELLWDNRETVRSAAEPATITLSHATDVGTLDTGIGKANAAQVTTRPGEATWQRAWELPAIDNIVAIPGTTTWIFPMDDDVIAIESGTVPRLYQSAESASTVPVWSGSVNSGYVFVFDSTETEELLDQNMVNATDQSGFDDGQFLRLVVTNSDGTGRTGRFRLKSDGTGGTDPQPALRIAGLVLARPAATTSTVTFPAEIEHDGRQSTLNIGGGDWRQHQESAEEAAQWVLRRATQPIPVFDRISTPGDPRRQLTDRQALEFGSSGQLVKAYIMGFTRTFDGRSLRDDLTTRATHAPGRWALGDAELGRLESTATLG